jgi:Zn-dependent peptidase ImmA (M78 family)
MQDNLPSFGSRKKLAKDLAKKLLKDSKQTVVPVSLYRVIEYLQTQYNLDVKRIEIGERVSGLLVLCKGVDKDFVTIGFNGKHSWCRRRFTIAHEIGHLLLGHVCSKNQEDESHNETEANVFAGELLVPTTLVKLDYKKTPNLQKLSMLYRVSEMTLTLKLMDAHLI